MTPAELDRIIAGLSDAHKVVFEFHASATRPCATSGQMAVEMGLLLDNLLEINGEGRLVVSGKGLAVRNRIMETGK